MDDDEITERDLYVEYLDIEATPYTKHRFDILLGRTQVEFNESVPTDYYKRMLLPCEFMYGYEKAPDAFDPFINPKFDSIFYLKKEMTRSNQFWEMCKKICKTYFRSKDSPIYGVPLTKVFMAEFVESFVSGTHHGMEGFRLQMDLSFLRYEDIMENPDEYRLTTHAVNAKIKNEIPNLYHSFSQVETFLQEAVTYERSGNHVDLTQNSASISQATQTEKTTESTDSVQAKVDFDTNVYQKFCSEKDEKTVFRFLIDGSTQMVQDAFLIVCYYYQNQNDAFLYNMYTDALVGQLLAEQHQGIVALVGSEDYISAYTPLRGRDLLFNDPPGNDGLCPWILQYPPGLVLYYTPKVKVEYTTSLYNCVKKKSVAKTKERHWVQYIMKFDLQNVLDENDDIPSKRDNKIDRVKEARIYKTCNTEDDLKKAYLVKLQRYEEKKRRILDGI